jgi:hypothetical protein
MLQQATMGIGKSGLSSYWARLCGAIRQLCFGF